MSEAMTTTASLETAAVRPVPREHWELLSQGAEARVWKLPATDLALSSGGGGGGGSEERTTIVCKERFSKAYRHPDLDKRLTNSRCRGEARALEKCAKSGIRVPAVLKVEPPLLYMEYIGGTSLKSYLLDTKDCIRIPYPELAEKMGRTLGTMHNLGIVHGDLTTSNMLVLEDDGTIQLVLIDFGLAKSTTSVEEQAVDLYVLERALQSTHPELPENFLDMVLESYEAVTKNGDTNKPTKPHQQSTLKRLDQVRLRGRKRECFG